MRVYSAVVELLPEDHKAQRALASILKQSGQLQAALGGDNGRGAVEHEAESAEFYKFVEELRTNREVDVAVEPTGIYGDALRFQLAERGLQVYHVNPIMVHDSREFYGGVPSSHNAHMRHHRNAACERAEPSAQVGE
ncbi:MAG: IS110 family transposase [Myxococcales bacterium]|nr:IS110 family transposase [Myxococcales bacterium]